MTASALAPKLDYTGEFKDAGLMAFPVAGTLRGAKLLQLDDVGPAIGDRHPFYDNGAGQTARLRLDLLVRRNTAGAATGKINVVGVSNVQQPFLDLGDITGGQSAQIFTLSYNAGLWQSDSPNFLQLAVTVGGPGEYEYILKLRPYSLRGWENAVLTTDATLRQVESYVFNQQFFPLAANGYPNEIRLAKREVYNRLVTSQIDPDKLYGDGAVSGDPSGIGPNVVPELVLAATYNALFQIYKRFTGEKDGFLAEKAEYYGKMFDHAMGVAERGLSVTIDEGFNLKSQEVRLRFPLRMMR